jgi:hypothetical protein
MSFKAELEEAAAILRGGTRDDLAAFLSNDLNARAEEAAREAQEANASSDPLASLDPETKQWIAQRHTEYAERGYCADWTLAGRIKGRLKKRLRP